MKTKTLFVCQVCGTQSPKWLGKCPGCNNWNTLVEEQEYSLPPEIKRNLVFHDEPVLLTDVLIEKEERLTTRITEVDRVLGGGLMRGSVTLVGGDPGIGKSTLCLQVGCQLSQKGYKVLYVSGEESVKQTKMRADRLLTDNQNSFYIVNQVDLNVILDYIDKIKPTLVIVDSIQVMYHPELNSSPGSVSQVRECAAILTQIAKAKGIALFIIGHMTKEGMIAGPMVLEHIVDTVLYFEGERYSSYRILRTTKNRFGSTNEIGVFEMTANGLKEVLNPSQIFLSERPKDSSGSVVVPIMEGTRPFLVEIQGLVSRASFGVVRHKSQGFDVNRLSLLVAVLEKRLGLNLQDKDIFLNVVGGVKVMDPAADLAVVMAIASSLLERIVSYDAVFLGEVGLSAEIRSVSQILPRINEAEKLGFRKCIIPTNNQSIHQQLKNAKIEIIGVKTVKEALENL